MAEPTPRKRIVMEADDDFFSQALMDEAENGYAEEPEEEEPWEIGRAHV